MKITRVICQIPRIPEVESKCAGTQDTVIVRGQTDAGIEGIGEVAGSPEVARAIIDAPFSNGFTDSDYIRQRAEDSPLRHDLTNERLQTDKDCFIRVPDRPGLGVLPATMAGSSH